MLLPHCDTICCSIEKFPRPRFTGGSPVDPLFMSDDDEDKDEDEEDDDNDDEDEEEEDDDDDGDGRDNGAYSLALGLASYVLVVLLLRCNLCFRL